MCAGGGLESAVLSAISPLACCSQSFQMIILLNARKAEEIVHVMCPYDKSLSN